ncbi:Ppx/GppA phosphatase family protein [Ideonella sp. BN130291]|uniref:Ppx/GppA phosphatase family protein n=1 Tax=Ideonella sp. BN130291 TaxID=3112940 RepID=UPI002E25FABE|nr:Ppx/GppA phosphatase family protein [Ideonella sp. BN130291]
MQDKPPTAAHVPLAAIDIGSNSFRLEIGQLEEGRYRRIDYVKDTVRLGAGLGPQAQLSEEAAQRGLACLARFRERLVGFAPWQVRAVATQTLREASNRDDFLKRGQQALGQPIEVISGREEARLIYAGVAHLQPSPKPRLVIDIGGRSTELILGRGRKPLAVESFPVGSVGLSMRYFADGRLTADAFRAAQVAAGAQIEESIATFGARHWREALGSSGTAGAVSQVLAAEGVTDGRITPQALAWCIERCLAAGHVDKLAFAGLREDRRPVIAGGLAILYTLCALLGIRALQPAKGALRQGVIIDLDARLRAAQSQHPLDMRDTTVRELQHRFGVDIAQARRVEAAALALHDRLGSAPAGGEARRELAWAAALHEIGMLVSHHDHHRHSAYLLTHADAAGFSQSQQRRIGALVLGQRGGLRKVEAELASPGFAHQLLCLRLAVIAAHGRHDVDIGGWHLAPAGQAVELRVVGPDPKALHLLREEAAHWQKVQGVELRLVEMH